jgi:hypothetical protein
MILCACSPAGGVQQVYSLCFDYTYTLFNIRQRSKVACAAGILNATDNEGRALVAGAFAALVPELAKDVALFEQLDAEEMQLTDLLTRIQHTKRVAAHESYKVATQLYGQYQSLTEAGVPGAVTRYNMLKERFKDNGGGRPPATNA